MASAAHVAANGNTGAWGGHLAPRTAVPVSRESKLPKRLQPMLATLTDAPFNDPEWIFEDKYDGFRMVSEIRGGKVALYSRNGKIISHSYVEVARALEGVKTDAVIDGELIAIGKDGVSHFQLLQNALRHEAKLLYCAFDLMFANGEDLRKLPLLERKKRLKAVLPHHKLIAFSAHRKGIGKKFFAEAERRHLEGHHGQARGQPVRLGRPDRRLAEGEDRAAAGSRDCRLYRPAPHSAILRRADLGGARERRLAIHRARRHGLQSRSP
jgi:ATP-dependent DNA ligase